MKLTLIIASENEAFAHDDGRTETARLLGKAAGRVEAGEGAGKLLDSNGNTVGSFVFEPNREV